jgi:hypothetical protein
MSVTTPPSDDFRQSSCMGKHPFSDRRLAEQVARRQNQRNDKAKVQPYRCGVCGQLHLGKPRRST